MRTELTPSAQTGETSKQNKEQLIQTAQQPGSEGPAPEATMQGGWQKTKNTVLIAGKGRASHPQDGIAAITSNKQSPGQGAGRRGCIPSKWSRAFAHLGHLVEGHPHCTGSLEGCLGVWCRAHGQLCLICDHGSLATRMTNARSQGQHCALCHEAASRAMCCHHTTAHLHRLEQWCTASSHSSRV